jgi:hypothetical protein
VRYENVNEIKVVEKLLPREKSGEMRNKNLKVE